MFKKLLSLALALVMALCLLPTTAFPPLTARADQTISVYFLDAEDWGDVYCSYWGDGSGNGRPGDLMTMCDFTDAGCNVYTISVPADITGLQFNDGDSRHTDDITYGIAEGAAWALASGITICFELNVPSPDAGYYVAFTTEQTSDVTLHPEYKLSDMGDGVYAVSDVTLMPEDEIYIVWSDDGVSWDTAQQYPFDPYVCAAYYSEAALCDVFFRPDGQGDSSEGWKDGFVRTEYKSPVYSDYYLVGVNGWDIQQRYRMVQCGAGLYTCTVWLTPQTNFQVALSEDGESYNDETLWPNAHYGSTGEITEKGYYAVFFRPDGGGDINEGWYEGYVRAERRYVLNVYAANGNGTATGTVGSGEPANVFYVPSGTEVTLTATPDDHYSFDRWVVLYYDEIEVIDNKITLTDKDLTVQAMFHREADVLFDFENYDSQTALPWGAYADLENAADDGVYNGGYVSMDSSARRHAKDYISPGLRERVRVVNAGEGEVHGGSRALAYTIDYTQSTDYGVNRYGYLYYWGDPISLVDEDELSDQGARLGMWMYIPEEAVGMKAQFVYTCKKSTHQMDTSCTYFDYQYVQGGMNSITSETIPAAGWAYVSVNLRRISSKFVSTSFFRDSNNALTHSESSNYAPAFIKWTVSDAATGAEKVTFYIDDITLDYYDPTEDRTAPVIGDITYFDDTMAEPAAIGGSTAYTSSVSFAAAVADDPHYPTGVNAASAKVFIDGIEVPAEYTANEEGGVIEAAVVLPNGVHDVVFAVADLQGNLARAEKTIAVADPDAAYPAVYAEGERMNGAAPILCGELYNILIKTDTAEAIGTVTADIKLNTASTWELDHMTAAPGYTAEYTLNETTNVATVTVTCVSGGLSGAQTLVTIPVRNYLYDGSTGYTPSQQWGATIGKSPILTLSWDVRAGAVGYKADCAPDVQGYVAGFGGERVDEDTELYADHDTVNAEHGVWHEHDAWPLEDLAPGCTTDGYSGRTFCNVCNSVVEWGETLSANGHSFLVDEDTVALNDERTAATCVGVCCECGDEESFETDEVSLYDVAPASCTAAGEEVYEVFFPGCQQSVFVHAPLAALGHDLTAYPETPVTCTENGNTAYWRCETCGRFFSDAEGTDEIDEDSWIVPFGGHTYGAPQWTWTDAGDDAEQKYVVTVSFDCVRGDDTQTPEVTVTDAVTTEPTFTLPGVRTYTASAAFDGQIYTDEKTEEIPAQAITVTTQPVNAEATFGSRAYFSVEASSETALTYQWQYTTNGGATWKDSTAATSHSADLSIAANAVNAKLIYHCVIANAYGSVTTNEVQVVLTDDPPEITAQPVNAAVTEDERVYFSVEASGVNLSYQWQYSKDEGETWKNSKGNGANTAELDIAGSAFNATLVYRCVISNHIGTAVSDEVRAFVTVIEPGIETQPHDTAVSGGERAYFSVEASGTGLTYRWQYSYNNGVTWVRSKGVGADTANLNIAGSTDNARLLYRCVVSNTKGTAISNTVRMTVADAAPVLLTKPVNAVVKEGDRAYFHVSVSGVDVTCQWQYTPNNGRTWYDSTGNGADTPDLDIAGSEANAKLKYRCVITNDYGSVTTAKVRVIIDDAQTQ